MPKANSALVLSNAIGRYPLIAPEPAPKQRLMDRLREALRSRHYSRRTEFRHGLFHLTHIDLFRPENPSPFAGEGFGRELSRTVGVRGIKMGNPIRPGSGRVAKNCKGDAKKVSKDGKGLAFDGY